ncbi:MAG: ATP-binding protein [Candidatus Omnitrophota bacterium]
MNCYLLAYRLSLYLTTFTTFVLGCFILLKAQRNKTSLIYVAFLFSLAGWSLLQVSLSVVSGSEKLLLISRLAHVFIIILPCLFLHFTYLFLDIEKENRKTLILAYLISLGFIALLPFKAFIPGVRYLANIKYFPTAGPIYHFHCAFFYMLVILCIYELHRGYRNSKGLRATQLKYMFWSAIIGFSAGSSSYLYVYNKPMFFNPYATFGVPLYVLTIAYIIYKHRFMDISLVLKKTVIYGIIYSLSLAVFGSIVMLLGQLAMPAVNQGLIGLSMLAVFVIVSMVKPLDKFLSTLTDKFLFRERYEYHKTLREASQGMIRIRELDKLLNLIVTIITKHVRVKQAAIFIYEKETNAYVVKASRGRLKIPKNYLKVTRHNPLLKYLLKTKDSIVCEELKLILKQGPSIALKEVIEKLDNIEVSICVPSFLKGKLIGFLLLGEKLSGEMYSQEDLSLFNTLSIQAGLAIENAQAYEELSRTKDRLFEAEKFASIGRLAGGIAHEIKNPLASIKTFTAYLNRKFDNPEFRSKFQRIVGSEVDRINHIVEQLVTYAHPKSLQLEKTDIHKIIEETLSLLENELKKAKVEVKTNYYPKNAMLSVDPEQFKQVFLNLFLNSIQAMEHNNGELKELKVSTYRQNGCLKVVVSDSGEGIHPEKVPLVFDPFFTTKESGCGLGLSIVKSIVESHRGKISVKSELSHGAAFCISLPLKNSPERKLLLRDSYRMLAPAKTGNTRI